MRRVSIGLQGWWKLVVYTGIRRGSYPRLAAELRHLGCGHKETKEIAEGLNGNADAFACSFTSEETSVVGFKAGLEGAELMDCVVHEAEHVKQAMLKRYGVADEGEAPAYTVAYIAKRIAENI